MYVFVMQSNFLIKNFWFKGKETFFNILIFKFNENVKHSEGPFQAKGNLNESNNNKPTRHKKLKFKVSNSDPVLFSILILI